MKKNPVVLILDNIRSTLNVGAIFRTADATNISKIYLSGITATPDHPKIPKTALGAEKNVPWEHVDNLKLKIKGLKTEGFTVYALELHPKAEIFWNVVPEYPLAIILGGEVDGVHTEILKICDKIVSIPMSGKKESLNVATATGIVLYEFVKPFLNR